MGRCRHKRTHTFEYAEGAREHEWIPCVQRMCIDCREQLPLGPARDDGPHAEQVALEIRAAELVDEYNADTGWWDGYVSLGMCSPDAEHAPLIEDGIAKGRRYPRDLADYYAGHLARCIATHDDGGNDD